VNLSRADAQGNTLLGSREREVSVDRMDDLEAFLAIVEKGSQTAAAKYLRRSLQSIGRSLAALERSVGSELVRRSTRRSQPTEAGLALYHRLKPALLEINDAKREVASKRAEPFGVLRIAAPVRFASAFVVPVICDFMQRYGQISVELKTSDRKVNLQEEDVDLAIRIRDLPDSGLRARRLAELRIVVFGAPAYLERHGRPRHPTELERHQCVVRNADPDGAKWPFRIDGKREMVRVTGRFATDDAHAVHDAVAGGLGLGLAPAWQIQHLLDQGAVEIILEDFESAKLPVFAVSPSTKLPLAKTRLFVDMLATRLKRARL
jgi:DNA-binding transcriptional LysR family regulator